VKNWFLNAEGNGWLTCPITENGCIRILSAQVYARPKPAISVIHALRKAFKNPTHHFVADDFSLTDSGWLEPSLLTSSQVTDIYLQKLAIKNNARLVTLDRRIKHSAVEGATPDHLLILRDP
jgi:predicted nucleic acid-binding protein